MAGYIYQQVRLNPEKIRDPHGARHGITSETPVLILLAAGKGTRFGTDPKCIAPVLGKPLARHSIDNFLRFSSGAKVLGVVGYKHEEVAAALGDDVVAVVSENPVGGTAWAVYEAFSVSELLEKNPPVVISMGDRMVPSEIFRRIVSVHLGREAGNETHGEETAGKGPRQADLTILTAIYDAKRIRGKGRVVRNEKKRIVRIMEERDIMALAGGESSTGTEEGQNADASKESTEEKNLLRNAFLSLHEGNCPLYVIRARKLMELLMLLSNDNAQNQYYLTDIIEKVASEGGMIRSITVSPSDPEFEILCADVTRMEDIPRLESALSRTGQELSEISRAVGTIRRDRPAGQVASIRRQLSELRDAIAREKLDFDPNAPFSIGIAGGRFRIAFMHPDMGRFFGPAWQVPIGACREAGMEQIVVFLQRANDRRLHLYPLAEQFRETVASIDSDREEMYPDHSVSDWYTYEEFGTRMSERLLLSLGYFSDEEIDRRRGENVPLPPESLWVSNSMRRPFSLVGNALASLRTYHVGEAGKRIAAQLGRGEFTGLRMVSTGLIPQGGFSCSSSLTIAVKNALSSLYHFGLTPDEMIDLAAQAEYGTGVRAGSLDQATVQKGRPGVGTLISSNPRDHYAILGEFPFPAERISVIFPYTTPRDSGAWKWSGGFYASDTRERGAEAGRLTTTEMRKLTGKSAEIAALLVRLPLDVDFFDEIKDDLMEDGFLTDESRRHIAGILLRLPLWIRKKELAAEIARAIPFYEEELVRCRALPHETAAAMAKKNADLLLTGWREPIFRLPDGTEKTGVPLRAMLAYLYGEMAKNFCLIHHPDRWIELVTASQRGDRCFDLDLDAVPERDELQTELDWEKGVSGPIRLERWLEKLGARPFDFNAGLDDVSLRNASCSFYALPGGNFFRGLALIDLAEAFLKKAFGTAAVAVRVNAAGQGDYFQIHIDRAHCSVDNVKEFMRKAFYDRFEIRPETEFIDIHDGGGAVGIYLSRFASLERLIEELA
ncbi:MAG: NTP transferase domain-containing protein [Thermoguttaceae bacterium]|jgi:CTP:molybdopterin cytidylyltransferase MocA